MNPRGRRRPVTARGEQTVDALLQAATSAFSEHGFHRTSVAAICRHAHLANGTFYQYFANKESIYLELVADTSDELLAHLSDRISADAPIHAQLIDALRAYWQFIETHSERHQIMREAEFVRLDVSQSFYRRLAAFYQSLLQQDPTGVPVTALETEALAYSLIGLSEFIALRYLIWQRAFSTEIVETIDQLLCCGVDLRFESPSGPADHATPAEIPASNGSDRPPEPSTRTQILAAAEAEFGQHGFHAASVADIARRAGVAHGTVYTYFPSKEALFTDVVREINRQLRATIRQQTAGLDDRRSAEHEGFRAFFAFIGQHAPMYRVVREAEFVGSASERVGPWYYHRLAEGYVQGIRAAIKRNEWRNVDAEVLAWALMGIAHFWGLRWVVWERSMPPQEVFAVLDGLLRAGLTS